MATPTKAEYWTQIGTIIDIIANVYASEQANIVTQFDTVEQAFEGNHIAATSAGMAVVRGAIDGALSAGRQMLTPLFLDMARTQYNVNHGGDVIRALLGVRREMAANSETIKYRNITRDTVAYGGSNVGKGAVYRCYTDQYNMAMEAGYAAQKTVLDCIADKNTGAAASGREVFRIWGEGKQPIDNLDIGAATSEERTITAIRPADCLLQNGSFEEGTGTTTSTTAITGWSADSGTIGTEMQRSVAAAASGTVAGADGEPYRNKPGKTTGQMLTLTGGTCTLTQKWSVKNIGKKFDPSRPLFIVARIRPSTGTAFTGTFSYRVGSQTGSLASGSMAGGWEDVELVTFNGQYAWYDNFREDDIRISVGLSAYTQGSLYVDEILMIQPMFYDGVYYVVTAGYTDWLRGLYSVTDTADFTDTSADTGEMQYWIQRLYGVYMPHTSGAATYADIT